MTAWPNPALPLLLVATLLAFEDWLTTPSCPGGPPEARASGGLRAMMVADLMLLGSDASYADRYFRDHFMSKFFAKSIQTLKPDMIIVLGDISAKGLELTEHKWISVIEQFEGILGRYSSLPLHIALGDKDVDTLPIWMAKLCIKGPSICQDWIQVVLEFLILVIQVLCL